MAKETEKRTEINSANWSGPHQKALPNNNPTSNGETRDTPEYTTQLSDGIVIYINQIGSYTNESKRFLITDTTGKYGSFVITPNGAPLKGEILTKAQLRVVQQIKKLIQEISS